MPPQDITSNCYCKIDGVKGESRAAGHQDWIGLTEVHYHQGLPVSRGGPAGSIMPAGHATFENVKIAKVTDLATTELLKLCARGKVCKDAVIHFGLQGDGSKIFLRIVMQDVLIASVQHVTDFPNRPSEVVELAYDRIGYVYTQFNNRSEEVSTIGAGWDVAKNDYWEPPQKA